MQVIIRHTTREYIVFSLCKVNSLSNNNNNNTVADVFIRGEGAEKRKERFFLSFLDFVIPLLKPLENFLFANSMNFFVPLL